MVGIACLILVHTAASSGTLPLWCTSMPRSFTIWSYLSVGKRVCEIPAHAQQDDFALLCDITWTLLIWAWRQEQTYTISHPTICRSGFCNTTLWVTTLYRSAFPTKKLSYYGSKLPHLMKVTNVIAQRLLREVLGVSTSAYTNVDNLESRVQVIVDARMSAIADFIVDKRIQERLQEEMTTILGSPSPESGQWVSQATERASDLRSSTDVSETRQNRAATHRAAKPLRHSRSRPE